MDVFSSYHQIGMYLPNVEKMAFITKNVTYYYQMMPFGLKNTGATYQRMVNKVFKDLLGEVMKAYVDNMIVKSKQDESHTKQLEKVFTESQQVCLWSKIKKILEIPDYSQGDRG